MRRRFFIFWFFLFFAFGILFGRLFQLQIVEGEKNRKLVEEQRISLRKIKAPRGEILDREGRILARNIPVFKRWNRQKREWERISREEALHLEAEGEENELSIDVLREYPYGEATSHLLGYLGEVNKEELGNYALGDLKGRTGIEEEYEEILRGIDGGELFETDTSGRIIRKIGKKEPIAGKDVKLSINLDLQLAAFEALKGEKGGVIAQNPNTGEVLVLVSSPSFNPNKITKDELTDPGNPFFNRVISGIYPPGSTFKIITAAAGLEEGKIRKDTKIEDLGVITVGKYRYANWYFTQYGKTEGMVDLVWALKRSTDTFFYKVGEWVGAEKIIEWGRKFGLGKVLGIDLPGESSGFLPNPSGEEWFLGNTYHLAIGQGGLMLTPLQVNVMTSVIASRGKLCRPYLFVSQGAPERDFGERENANKSSCFEVGLKKETISLITEGMKEACSQGGTAFPLFDFKPQVACKTGTAEFDDPAGRTHAWLTAFAPIENPEIVVTALVEAGGEGSSVAAPIVKKVLDAYFHR